jgi:hypothetical protein
VGSARHLVACHMALEGSGHSRVGGQGWTHG